MKKNKEMCFQMLSVFAGVLILVLGFYLMIPGFFRAHTQHEDEYADRLIDVTNWVDDHLNGMITRLQNNMRDMLQNVDSEEKMILSTGKKEAMLYLMKSLEMMKADYIQCCLLLQDDQVLLSSDGRVAPAYTFPMGLDDSLPFVTVDEAGRSFFCIAAASKQTNLKYVLVMDWELFSEQVIGNALSNDYGIFLYCANGLYLKKTPHKVSIEYIVREPSQGSVLSLFVEAETENLMTIQNIMETKNEDGIEVDRKIAILPSGMNHNGIVSVGVTTEITYLSQLVYHFSLQMLMCCVMVFVGCSILLILISRSQKANNELKEKTELLRVQNQEIQQLLDKTQKLSHHQALETIGVMTSGIAHEFSNLLTPIMGYSIMSMEKLPPDSDELLDNLNEIYSASQRAKSLISRICALSRKENGNSLQQVSPDVLMDKAWEMVQSSKPNHISVVKHYSCPERCLMVNESKIIHLLLNIILNAISAMEEAGGVLELSTLTIGENVLFCLRDTGIGIAPDVLPHIFEPFYTTKCEGRGTGLGLAIAWQIAEAHGGSIQAESAEGKGTTFTVILPYHRAQSEEE